MTSPGKTLRELLQSEELVMAPGAPDALTARLIEQAGFPAVYMTGFGATASLIGCPDIGLLSQTEMTTQARNMVRAVDVPVIADADTGQLLGAAAIGAHATELIATAVTAVQAELTAAEFARTIQAHPTLAEAWMEAAHAVHGQCIHAPPRRKHVERKA